VARFISHPSAGTNRIRFYGFADHPHLRQVRYTCHPEEARIIAQA
jgi:hypothetical protein